MSFSVFASSISFSFLVSVILNIFWLFYSLCISSNLFLSSLFLSNDPLTNWSLNYFSVLFSYSTPVNSFSIEFKFGSFYSCSNNIPFFISSGLLQFILPLFCIPSISVNSFESYISKFSYSVSLLFWIC
jgi:hypothetical protein